MSNFYQNAPKHLLAVDCVIFGYEDDQLKILLFPRKVEPAKGQWSLIGGFVNENESTDDAASRVLLLNTGLSNIFMELLKVFSAPGRDPGARVVSVVYFALIRSNSQDDSILEEKDARWWPIADYPPLIFDHQQMVEDALSGLQMKAGQNLTGHELLPDVFTLRQLRTLYEAILQKPLDPGNFRKKVLSLNVLQKLDIKETTKSKKGAYYYQFAKDVAHANGNMILKL
ncbi:MAG: NUDIX hydrolase [Bacteroidales bacterium]|nr:NUDIX hydrolase [Bacteroidales bacterium]